jgi:hypothetical protein
LYSFIICSQVRSGGGRKRKGKLGSSGDEGVGVRLGWRWRAECLLVSPPPTWGCRTERKRERVREGLSWVGVGVRGRLTRLRLLRAHWKQKKTTQIWDEVGTKDEVEAKWWYLDERVVALAVLLLVVQLGRDLLALHHHGP